MLLAMSLSMIQKLRETGCNANLSRSIRRHACRCPALASSTLSGTGCKVRSAGKAFILAGHIHGKFPKQSPAGTTLLCAAPPHLHGDKVGAAQKAGPDSRSDCSSWRSNCCRGITPLNASHLQPALECLQKLADAASDVSPAMASATSCRRCATPPPTCEAPRQGAVAAACRHQARAEAQWSIYAKGGMAKRWSRDLPRSTASPRRTRPLPSLGRAFHQMRAVKDALEDSAEVAEVIAGCSRVEGRNASLRRPSVQLRRTQSASKLRERGLKRMFSMSGHPRSSRSTRSGAAGPRPAWSLPTTRTSGTAGWLDGVR